MKYFRTQTEVETVFNKIKAVGDTKEVYLVIPRNKKGVLQPLQDDMEQLLKEQKLTRLKGSYTRIRDEKGDIVLTIYYKIGTPKELGCIDEKLMIWV